ncbi:copper/zinc superoxide dismutase [Puccinia graminis f. sp. tritici CRL 75-36-700-3]|uniref:Copper/zinc superoxide dismutase n=2 Tax=Puccinia graminis f. sp. tritici TaxID=56615 RepID=E3KB73_PUCGT|nr:copper/zinc superoxide dismutase [Puccinia graminis f. sp. tritici CRL 75-36-700-3]EFP81586.2 copper/zinc superoxide dismutase [Puccinia graminis f. sp. tritici CRL 75-36-700-3]
MQFWQLLVLVSQLGMIAAVPNQHAVRNSNTAVAFMKGAGGLKGVFVFVPEGNTIKMSIEYSGVPEGQSFAYHIHEKAYTNGNCGSGGGFWNPTRSTMKAPGSCVAHAPGHCASGDLSGKHGKLVGHGAKSTSLRIFDPSLKITGSSQGIIGKTLMIHNAEGTPVACDIIAHKA